jgi:hypothetical protein
LLPSPLDKTIQVATPTLFAKPGFWGLRRLTSEEILLAKDLSETDAEKLAWPSCEGSFLRAFAPGKCLVFGFRALFYGGGLFSTPKTGTITQFTRRDEEIGGWNVSEGSGRVANVKRVFVRTGNSADQDKLDGTVGGTKRQKGCETYWTDQDNFDGAGEAVGSSKRRVGTVGPTKRESQTKASRIPTEDSATQETCLSSIEDSVTQESSDGIIGACGASDCWTKDSGHSGKSENPKPGTQEDLTKMGQERRNRKATKPDDAEVPEYIWYDHVFEDGARTWT